MTLFSNVTMAAKDPLFSLNEMFNADPNPAKINLVIGVYTDEDGKIPLMQSVQAAAKIKHEEGAPHAYLPIEGMPKYREVVQKLLFREQTEKDRIVTVQTLGGTGALKVGADFLKHLLPDAVIAISDPSWENHQNLFQEAGFPVVSYTYYNPATHSLNFTGMLASLNSLPENSIIVLHACCHNPTGIDLSPDQWQQVMKVCQEKSLIPFFDMAYQGFGKSLSSDNEVIQKFTQAGISFLIAHSFSKNFSLYGERVGALSVVTQNKHESAAVLSQLKRLIRTNYSNPSTYGAALISIILDNAELQTLWEDELATMRDRIRFIRTSFVNKLKALSPENDFSFINDQNGMFSYSGLTADQVERLRVEHSLYIVPTGRICLARLTQSNIDAVTQAIKTVL